MLLVILLRVLFEGLPGIPGLKGEKGEGSIGLPGSDGKPVFLIAQFSN